MKKKKIVFILFLIITSLLIIYLSRNRYFNLFYRIKSLFNQSQTFEKYGDINNSRYSKIICDIFYNIASGIINFAKYFNSWNDFLTGVLLLLTNIIKIINSSLLYLFSFVYFLVFLFLFRKLMLVGENNVYKVSKASQFLNNIIESIKNHLNYFKGYSKKFIDEYKNELKIIGFVYLLSSGIIFVILTELIIWLIKMVIAFMTSKQLDFSLQLVVAIIGYLINLFLECSSFTKILFLISLFFYLAFDRSFRRLEWNKQQRINSIFNVAGTLNLFQGFPSAGKTKTISILTQDAEEQMIEELEQVLLDLEEEYPTINITYLIFLLNIKYGFYNEKDIKKILNDNKSILKDIQLIDKCISDDVKDMLEYAFNLLYVRGSFMASNYAIIDPLYENYDAGDDGFNYSHALDMEAFRWYQKINKMYFEPYMAIAIQEMDKEFNSHKDMKQINEEGTAVAFSAITHVCKRHVYIFADYQLKDQVPARIRGNAAAQIKIIKTSISYPFWIKVFKLIIGIPYFHFKDVIEQYRSVKERNEKGGLRFKPLKYKRNDVSLYFQVVKCLASLFGKMYSYLESFRFTRFECLYSYKDSFEPNDSETLIYYINDRELSFKDHKIYESCNLGNFFDELKHDKNDNSNINDLPYWKNLNPGYSFYIDNVHQHFYEDMVKAQFDKDTVYVSSSDVISKEEVEVLL